MNQSLIRKIELGVFRFAVVGGGMAYCELQWIFLKIAGFSVGCPFFDKSDERTI